MKAVILAGGFGTRLSEETHSRPKPMLEIGGMPIIWHIMKRYLYYGIDDFVICCGYKGYVIKDFFLNYRYRNSDIVIDNLSSDQQVILKSPQNSEKWRVTLIDTGLETQTGGRLKRVAHELYDEPFCMTYGDGVSNIDIRKSIDHFKADARHAMLTAVRQPGRFGSISTSGNCVTEFVEKPQGDNSWVNGGYFVLDPCVLDKIEGDSTNFEQDVLPQLANENRLGCYNHEGFWQPMDTLRDMNMLNSLWNQGNAPWRVW